MLERHSDPVPPPGVDLQRPSVARVYDYLLGGTANWAVDREFGDRIIEKVPLVKDMALANRLFLTRVVRYLTKRGVRQFLDIGAGVPTAGNTHQVADAVKREAGQVPDVRVVYVDNEPVAVAHAAMLLDSDGDPARHAVIEGDLRNPDELWQKARKTQLLNPDEPIALLLIAVLHVHQPDPDGNDIGAESVARFRDLLPRGSYLAISHMTADGVPETLVKKLLEIKRMYDESSSSDGIWRSRADIAAFLDDFRLVEPGWTWTPDWHPEESGPTKQTVTFGTSSESVVWAGVGEKIT
ncbi:SAM-dependent methyltransferase [Actinophytocola sp.]|uniref:SAM-dependent methyltransferase n=1 Tax=Actinophytocola sp. TaxID=1872138 RepID=UPI002ECFE581